MNSRATAAQEIAKMFKSNNDSQGSINASFDSQQQPMFYRINPK